jgi:glycerophosphoryl diester phosphodiesterase
LPVCVLAVFSLVAEGSAVEIIGHRGASHDAPENTLASVNLAWEQGADAVEIDIHRTKDGQIVAIHDATTKRYGGPDRKVAEQTLAELKSLDVGRWKNRKFAGERIPTLAEVLQTIPPGKQLLIEIKVGPEIVPELKKVIQASKRKPAEAVLIGFSYETMFAAKKALPRNAAYWVVRVEQDKKTGIWQPKLDELIRQTKAAGLDGLDLGNAPAVIDHKYAERVAKAGLGLYVWTVNDPDEAKRLRDAGVDGIATDRPGWLRERLAEDQIGFDVEESAEFCKHIERSVRANALVLTAKNVSEGTSP